MLQMTPEVATERDNRDARDQLRALVFAALGAWVRSRRGQNVIDLGYPHATLEARLRDEGGVLIAGKGLRLDQSDDQAEIVEASLPLMDPAWVYALEQLWLRGRTPDTIAFHAQCSRTTVRGRLDHAYDFLAGRLTT